MTPASPVKLTSAAGNGPRDLRGLRIDRDGPRRRRWLPWAVLASLAVIAAALYPSMRAYVDERRAPEVEIARAVQPAASPTGSTDLPVLVASGYVIARRTSEVGVKVGGRLAAINFEEGTRVRKGEILAQIEHADLDAQLAASLASVAEAETQLAQMSAQRDEDLRNLERQRALAKDGITTTATLTAAEAAAQVSVARVRAAEAAINSARARVKVTEEALENTNVRSPFDGIVVKKRAEVGETISPYGVQGQSSREGGAIATVADLHELEVQTEVNENSVAKLKRGMPAIVSLQAYQGEAFNGRLREIFPSADRAKSIVEVRVTILNADERVKPEMTASVTFQEPRSPTGSAQDSSSASAKESVVAPVILIPKRAVTVRNGRQTVWVVTNGTASQRNVTLGPERIDQVEVRSGVMPGDALILNPPPGLVDRGRVRVRGSGGDH